MDIRHGEDTIMMALFGLLEREEDREATHRMMVEAVRRGGRASERLEDGYAAYIEMPAKHGIPWRWKNLEADIQ